MRIFLKESDLIVCEIKSSSFTDKSIGLHIRYERFGKLGKGVLIRARNYLIKKMKTQFIEIEGIELLFAINGYIWIYTDNLKDSDQFELVAKLKNLIELLNEILIPLNKENLIIALTQSKSLLARDIIINSNRQKLKSLLKKIKEQQLYNDH